jgi:hypothetical protein
MDPTESRLKRRNFVVGCIGLVVAAVLLTWWLLPDYGPFRGQVLVSADQEEHVAWVDFDGGTAYIGFTTAPSRDDLIAVTHRTAFAGSRAMRGARVSVAAVLSGAGDWHRGSRRGRLLCEASAYSGRVDRGCQP